MTDFAQLDSDALKTIQNWGKKIRYFVGIDVGGTNTRVAISRDKDNDLVQVCKFQAKTVPDLLNGLSSVGKKLVELFDSPPVVACLAAAGPVSEFGEKVVVTNYHGSEVERTLLKSQISDTIFPKSNSRFINDLEGTCNGINALNEQNKLGEFFEPLWQLDTSHQKSVVSLNPVHYVVLAMGTGLGTALLQQDLLSRSPRHSVLPLEAGHSLVNELGPSHKEYATERDLIQHLSKKLYNGKTTIEYEDICSGRGLGYVYEYFTKESLSAAEIVKRASGTPPDNIALKALQIHYRYLLRVAQSLCISTQAKGVLLAGDNQVSNLSFVRSFVSALKEEFLNHVKVSWLQPVTVYTQTKSFNFNLAGALHFAKSLAK
jgi:glucokinase